MRHFRLVFCLALVAYLLSMVHRVAPAAISAQLQATFMINGPQLGLLAATYFYVYTLMQIPVGILADSFGPRFILTAGGLLAAAGSLLLGVAPDFTTALIARTIVGLGVSVTFIATLKIIAMSYPESHFARMTGWVNFVGNLGAVFAGWPLVYLSHQFTWQTIFISIGFLSLLIALVSFWKTPPLSAFSGTISGSLAPDLSLRFLWRERIRPVLFNRATWPGFFANVGLAGAYFSFAGLWAAPYLRQYYGYSDAQVGTHISLYFVGFAIGALFWGQLSDRLKRRTVVLRSAALLHVGAWLVLAFDLIAPSGAEGSQIGGTIESGMGATLFLCTVLGLSAASFTLHWACSKEVNPPALSGMATSVVNVGVFLGPALLQPVIGWVVEWHWDGRIIAGVHWYSTADLHRGIVALTITAVLGAAIAFTIRETYCQNIWHQLRD